MNVPLNYSIYPIDRQNIDEKHIRVLTSGEGIFSSVHSDTHNVTGKIEFFAHLENVNKIQMSKNAIVSNQSLVNKSQLEVDKIMLEK